MSAAASRLALGRLSSSEEELAQPADAPLGREMLEGLLYEHLYTAAQMRLRMDAAKEWSQEFHRLFVARDHALVHAARHYKALRELGAIDPFLDSMAMTELGEGQLR